MKYLLVLILLGSFTITKSQDTLFFDSYDPKDDNVIGDTTYAFTPKMGMVYSLLVDGAYSGWPNSFYTSPCGPSEFPDYPSPAVAGSAGYLVNFDMEHAFAYPTMSLCSTLGIPDPTDRIQISLDNGNSWFHPVTTDSLNSNHIYTYEIIGEDKPLMIRQESKQASDDYGRLRFIFREKALVGIKDYSQLVSITIFPNPVSEILHINSDILKLSSIRLMGMKGQLIYEKIELDSKFMDIDVSELNEGIYILDGILEDGSAWRKRVVINH